MTSKLVVTKDNQLIQAGYTLSISEQRVILLCIAKIDSRQKIQDNHEFTISVDDLCNEIGVAKENAYRDLRNAVNSLYRRTIQLDPNESDTEMRWLYKKAFFNSEGIVTLSFSPTLLPYISELKERFTTYKLKDVAKFKSSYSLRFYEILIRWKCRNELKVDVVWLRNILQLGDKYARVSDIKKYVVIPAIKDINAFSNMEVDFEQVKKGKEITHFIFKYKVGGVIDNTAITRSYVEKHARIGESWEDATKRLTAEMKNNTSDTRRPE